MHFERHLICLVSMSTIACLFNASCSFQNSEEQSKNIETLHQEMDAIRPLVKADFHHQFKKNEDGSYSVVVSWPAGRPLQIKIIQNGITLQTLDGRTESTFQLICNADQLFYSAQVVSVRYGTLIDVDFGFDCQTGDETKIKSIVEKVSCYIVAEGTAEKAGEQPEFFKIYTRSNYTRQTMTNLGQNKTNSTIQGQSNTHQSNWVAGKKKADLIWNINRVSTIETITTIQMNGLKKEQITSTNIGKKTFLNATPKETEYAIKERTETISRMDENQEVEITAIDLDTGESLALFATTTVTTGDKRIETSTLREPFISVEEGHTNRLEKVVNSCEFTKMN